MSKAFSFPRVSIKMAQSLDGKIATTSRQSKWITSEAAREHVQKIRASHDAVLVGKNTALLDNPSLALRGKFSKKKKQPWRIVLDPHYELKASSEIFNLKNTQQQTIRVVFESVLVKKCVSENKSFVILPVREKKGRVDLKHLLQSLKGLGIESVLVEGGAETAWSFISEKLVHKIYWFVAPKLIGGRGALSSLEGDGVSQISKAIPVKKMTVKKVGCDFLIEGEL